MNKKIIIIAVAGAAVLSGCATVGTAPDTVAVAYNAGPISAEEFTDCVAVSTRDYSGPFDLYYEYPASQRFYEFADGKDGADTGTYTFVTKDGIEMKVTGVLNFDLETECETLRVFHERIGKRSSAWFVDGASTDGWRNMLDVYLGNPLETAIDRAGQAYTYTELYNDPAIKAKWESDVVGMLPDLVGRQTDGEEQFFKNFSVTLQKPVPPQSVVDALTEQQAAVARANAAKAQADAQAIAAQAQVEVEKAEAAKAEIWISILGPEGYLKKIAAEHNLNPWQPSGVVTQPQPTPVP